MCAPHALANFTLGIKILGLIYNQGYFMGHLSCLAFSYLINGLKEAFLEKY